MKFQNPILNFKQVFDISSFAKSDNLKKRFFFNFHQVIYSLSALS